MGERSHKLAQYKFPVADPAREDVLIKLEELSQTCGLAAGIFKELRHINYFSIYLEWSSFNMYGASHDCPPFLILLAMKMLRGVV